MPKVYLKRIDRFGRISIPAEWREELGNEVLLIKTGQEIIIRPIRKRMRLIDLFDSVELEVSEEEFLDPHKLKVKALEVR